MPGGVVPRGRIPRDRVDEARREADVFRVEGAEVVLVVAGLIRRHRIGRHRPHLNVAVEHLVVAVVDVGVLVPLAVAVVVGGHRRGVGVVGVGEAPARAVVAQPRRGSVVQGSGRAERRGVVHKVGLRGHLLAGGGHVREQVAVVGGAGQLGVHVRVIGGLAVVTAVAAVVISVMGAVVAALEQVVPVRKTVGGLELGGQAHLVVVPVPELGDGAAVALLPAVVHAPGVIQLALGVGVRRVDGVAEEVHVGLVAGDGLPIFQRRILRLLAGEVVLVPVVLDDHAGQVAAGPHGGIEQHVAVFHDHAGRRGVLVDDVAVGIGHGDELPVRVGLVAAVLVLLVGGHDVLALLEPGAHLLAGVNRGVRRGGVGSVAGIGHGVVRGDVGAAGHGLGPGVLRVPVERDGLDAVHVIRHRAVGRRLIVQAGRVHLLGKGQARRAEARVLQKAAMARIGDGDDVAERDLGAVGHGVARLVREQGAVAHGLVAPVGPRLGAEGVGARHVVVAVGVAVMARGRVGPRRLVLFEIAEGLVVGVSVLVGVHGRHRTHRRQRDVQVAVGRGGVRRQTAHAAAVGGLVHGDGVLGKRRRLVVAVGAHPQAVLVVAAQGAPIGVLAQIVAVGVVGADGVVVAPRIARQRIGAGAVGVVLEQGVGLPVRIEVVVHAQRGIARAARAVRVLLVVVVPPAGEPIGAQGGRHRPAHPAVGALAPELHVGAVVVGQLVGGERRAALEVAQVHVQVAEVVAAPEGLVDDDVAIGLAVREHRAVGGDHLGRHGRKLIGIGDDDGGIDAINLSENGLGDRGYPVGLENGAAVGVLLHLLQIGVGRRRGQRDEIGAVDGEGLVHAGERVAGRIGLVGGEAQRDVLHAHDAVGFLVEELLGEGHLLGGEVHIAALLLAGLYFLVVLVVHIRDLARGEIGLVHGEVAVGAVQVVAVRGSVGHIQRVVIRKRKAEAGTLVLVVAGGRAALHQRAGKRALLRRCAVGVVVVAVLARHVVGAHEGFGLDGLVHLVGTSHDPGRGGAVVIGVRALPVLLPAGHAALELGHVGVPVARDIGVVRRVVGAPVAHRPARVGHELHPVAHARVALAVGRRGAGVVRPHIGPGAPAVAGDVGAVGARRLVAVVVPAGVVVGAAEPGGKRHVAHVISVAPQIHIGGVVLGGAVGGVAGVRLHLVELHHDVGDVAFAPLVPGDDEVALVVVGVGLLRVVHVVARGAVAVDEAQKVAVRQRGAHEVRRAGCGVGDSRHRRRGAVDAAPQRQVRRHGGIDLREVGDLHAGDVAALAQRLGKRDGLGLEAAHDVVVHLGIIGAGHHLVGHARALGRVGAVADAGVRRVHPVLAVLSADAQLALEHGAGAVGHVEAVGRAVLAPPGLGLAGRRGGGGGGGERVERRRVHDRFQRLLGLEVGGRAHVDLRLAADGVQVRLVLGVGALAVGVVAGGGAVADAVAGRPRGVRIQGLQLGVGIDGHVVVAHVGVAAEELAVDTTPRSAGIAAAPAAPAVGLAHMHDVVGVAIAVVVVRLGVVGVGGVVHIRRVDAVAEQVHIGVLPHGEVRFNGLELHLEPVGVAAEPAVAGRDVDVLLIPLATAVLAHPLRLDLLPGPRGGDRLAARVGDGAGIHDAVRVGVRVRVVPCGHLAAGGVLGVGRHRLDGHRLDLRVLDQTLR